MVIRSKDNDKFKLVKSLLKTKFRNKEDKYIAEGLRTVQLAIEYNADVEFIFVSESFSLSDDMKEFNENVKVYVLADSLFEQIITTENSQGIIAILKKNNMTLKDFNNKKYKRIVILDRVQDPGNMGTIIRTADACGYDLVVLTKGCVDVYNPKVVRSTMGSIFYMDIFSGESDEILEVLKSNDIEIISSYLKTDNDFEKVSYSEKTALVVGNEANGIDDFWIENSDILVKINMYGKAESFNVAISSALLMYRIR